MQLAKDSNLGNQSAAWILIEVKKESMKDYWAQVEKKWAQQWARMKKRSNRGRLRRRHFEKRSSARERQKWKSIGRISDCCKSNQ